jgi:hypothetical protein
VVFPVDIPKHLHKCESSRKRPSVTQCRQYKLAQASKTELRLLSKQSKENTYTTHFPTTQETGEFQCRNTLRNKKKVFLIKKAENEIQILTSPYYFDVEKRQIKFCWN